MASIVMLIVDVFHFIYIYNNQLAFYFVGQDAILVDKDIADQKGSLDRLNDLKWMEVENIEELGADKNDD